MIDIYSKGNEYAYVKNVFNLVPINVQKIIQSDLLTRRYLEYTAAVRVIGGGGGRQSKYDVTFLSYPREGDIHSSQ